MWNADLIIVSEPENSYKYILTVMDGFTRYAWVLPLKDKKGETVANAFKEIMKIEKPNKLWVDRGKEFYNQHMYSLFKFKDRDILEKDKNGECKNQIYSVFHTQKNPLIERFNITRKTRKTTNIKRKSKVTSYSSTIVKKYNNTIHRTIGTTPILASQDPSLVKVISPQFNKQLQNKKPKIKLNDRVRICK